MEKQQTKENFLELWNNSPLHSMGDWTALFLTLDNIKISFLNICNIADNEIHRLNILLENTNKNYTEQIRILNDILRAKNSHINLLEQSIVGLK